MSRIRMLEWVLIGLLLLVLVALLNPLLLPVLVAKSAMNVSFGTLGFFFDRGVAPYARPDNPDLTPPERSLAGIRRAIIIAAFTFAGGMGA